MTVPTANRQTDLYQLDELAAGLKERNGGDSTAWSVRLVNTARAEIESLRAQLQAAEQATRAAKDRYCEEFAKHAVTMVERDTARQDALNEAADYLDSVPTAIADPHSTANFLRAWAVQR